MVALYPSSFSFSLPDILDGIFFFYLLNIFYPPNQTKQKANKQMLFMVRMIE